MGQEWDVLDGLFRRGWIRDPKSKAKSVILTEDGERAAAELFEKFFGVAVQQSDASVDSSER